MLRDISAKRNKSFEYPESLQMDQVLHGANFIFLEQRTYCLIQLIHRGSNSPNWEL
uniref:Uncharacterized protein n=1 Tax=Candidatus Kentrum sp. TC TaxID=2126339 RepID=A0A451AFJ5_9GAMM|nr:MAG: hypothetical protein BECKTC1821F_GA0114240_11473 [Candidatus Kentron sp. TC]